MKAKVIHFVTKLSVALILIVILALKAFATEVPVIKMLPHTNNKAVIAFNNEVNLPAELSIEDENGDVLFYKEGIISNKVYTQMFDFDNLYEGTYTIKVKNSNGTNKLEFSVIDDEVIISAKNKNADTFFKLEEDQLKFSFLNHSLKPVNFSITTNGNQVFTKELGDNFSISTGFDLTKLPEGDYTAKVTDGELIYVYTFEK